jgi:hypothetical protein
LIEGIRDALPPVISHAHRDRLIATGTNIKFTRVTAGIQARAVFSPDVDLLVHVLVGDLSRAERVDVQLVDLAGTEQVHFLHVPFDPRSGEVLIACQRHYEHHPVSDPEFRVHAIESGVRREVGRYRVEHIWR